MAAQIQTLKRQVAELKLELGHERHLRERYKEQLDSFHRSCSNIQTQTDLLYTDSILDELVELSHLDCRHRHYSHRLFVFAKELYLISPAGYLATREEIPGLPHPDYLREHAKLFSIFRPDFFTDLANLDAIVREWKRENQIGTETTVYGSLAVDAVSFVQHLNIRRDGTIIGTINSDEKMSESAICRGNPQAQRLLEGVNPLRWATDAVAFCPIADGFTPKGALFLAWCTLLPKISQAFRSKVQTSLSLSSLVVGGTGCMAIRQRFFRATQLITSHYWTDAEDQLLIENLGKTRIPWKKLSEKLIRHTIAEIKARFKIHRRLSQDKRGTAIS